MKNLRAFKLSLFMILVSLCEKAWSYPDFIRHGYTNCMTCHVSPTGGGALTQYGREISQDALSTWSYKGEGNLLHGAIDPKKMPSWISAIGGDLRGLRVHVKSKDYSDDKWQYMQGDIEAGVILGAIRAHATVGRVENENEAGKFDLRKYYLMASIDKEHFLRVGKFQPVSGLNISEHTSANKESIGAEPLNTSYSAEFSWANENWNYWVTGFTPTNDPYTSNVDRGIYQNIAYNFSNHYKVGLSQGIAASTDHERTHYGAFAMLGFTKKFYSLLEANFIENKEIDNKLQGVSFYSKIAYEIHKGLIPFLNLELNRPDWHNRNTGNDETSQENKVGLGLQFFPRPHFEIQTVWARIQKSSPETIWADEAYLYLHYYL